MSFDYSKEDNPTVKFSEYANANPYFEKRDADGKVNRYLEEYYTVNQQHYTIENPLYNASLNSFDRCAKKCQISGYIPFSSTYFFRFECKKSER